MSLNQNKESKKDEFEDLINYNLNKIFLKDIYVTLTSYKLSVPVVAVIINYSDSILSVRFKKNSDYFKHLIIGDPVVINISDKDTLYSARSSVINCNSETIDLKVEKVSSKDDLRKEKRFLVGLSGEIKYDNNESFIIIKNISQTGLKFISKLNIPLGTDVPVLINTYEFLQINCIVKIVQKNTFLDNYSYGGTIKEIDNKSLKNLNTCIQNLTYIFEL